METVPDARYEVGATRTSGRVFWVLLIVGALLVAFSVNAMSYISLSAKLNVDETRRIEAVSAKSQRDAKDVSLVGCQYDSFEYPYATLRVTNRGTGNAASYYIVVTFVDSKGNLILSAYGVVDSLDPGQSETIKAPAGKSIQYKTCTLSKVSKV